MIKPKIDKFFWQSISEELDKNGFAILPEVLTTAQCKSIIELYERPFGFRKTVVMQKHNYGQGEYKYFDYPLPAIFSELRESVYPHLAETANRWMQQLDIDQQYPDTLDEFLHICHAAGQQKATPLILRYEAGGFNTMHQDIYGEKFFPLQMVLMLNEVDKDYTGGDFVLNQQRARAQAQAHVLRIPQGAALIFTSSFRPAQAKNGFYKVNVKHGVSTILSGQRHTAGIIFHDAK